MFAAVKYKLARIVERHPYVWHAVWTMVHHLPFLLPHDRSYYAVRHFGGDRESLLLDVGANDGISALSFRKLNPDIRILSLEPNPLHEPALQKLRGRMHGFDYKLVGAGEAADELRLFTPRFRGVVLHTFASSSAEQVRVAVEKSFGKQVAAELEIIEAGAPIVRVDDLDVAPHIIKIDVEGFDYKVLLGARATIERCRPTLIVEACHADLEQIRTYFDTLKYDMLTYDPAMDRFAPLQDGDIEYATGARNVFAVPAEKSAALPRAGKA